MGQFACECTATGSGRDQCDWTDLYVAQFKLLDGSVVYVGGCVEITARSCYCWTAPS